MKRSLLNWLVNVIGLIFLGFGAYFITSGLLQENKMFMAMGIVAFIIGMSMTFYIKHQGRHHG